MITVKDIIIIHDEIINNIGGSLGLREPGLLVSIVEKPATSYSGSDLYETVFDKSAALFEAICNYHVFVDGNKRTAIAVLEYYLFLNGKVLDASANQKESFVLNTATKHPSIETLAAWIEKHAKVIEL